MKFYLQKLISGALMLVLTASQVVAGKMFSYDASNDGLPLRQSDAGAVVYPQPDLQSGLETPQLRP
jgi:hypothetical protein